MKQAKKIKVTVKNEPSEKAIRDVAEFLLKVAKNRGEDEGNFRLKNRKYND